MNRGDIFELIPYREENIKFRAIVLDSEDSHYLCYAQNRLIVVSKDMEIEKVLCDYCVIPEADVKLEEYEESRK